MQVVAVGGMSGGRFDGLRLAALAIAFLVLAPLFVVLSALFSPAGDVWQHLVDNVLPGLLVNTFWLVLGVGAGTTLIGVSLAWLTAIYDFPGRRLFTWALMLPLALPAYVLAFVALGLLDYTGPVQTALREILGPDRVWFPRIQSTGGVIAVMTLALYPYVYLITRNAFVTQGMRTLEAAQSLGHTRASAFFRAALPMARPWIAAGLLLVLMETLADFGTVSVFNYDTFTTAIYKAWFGLYSLPAAAQLASLLMLIALFLLLGESLSRARMRYYAPGRQGAGVRRIPLARRLAWLASAYCGLVLLLAFVVPVAQLSVWALRVMPRDLDERYWGFLAHTLFLGALAALIAIAVAVVLAYAARQHRGLVMRIVSRVATLGYAVPGAVLAVGIFIPIAWLDNRLLAFAKAGLGVDIGLLLQGTIVMMLLAYLVRFLAAAHSPVEAAMNRLTPNFDEAARTFGLGRVATLVRVHLPNLKGGLLAGAILVFVDVMKEMPITLMTRPFGWDTMAVRIFEMTSEGEWERAALPAVALVLAGLLPILLLMRAQERH